MSDTTKRAVVNVAPRTGFNGYYSAGEFWANGTTHVEVVANSTAKDEAKQAAKKASEDRRFITEAQLAELRAERQMLSVMTPEQAAAQVSPGAMVLSDEERALVENHRKAKAQKSNEQPKK
jgi:hypothetical protein